LSASVDIRNPEGSVLVKGLQGAVSIVTVGGTISVLEAAEHLSVSSISGDIVIIRALGRVEATSISGTYTSFSPPVFIFAATVRLAPSPTRATWYLARTTISPATVATSTSFAHLQLLLSFAPKR
jgi:hypothetical protein